MGIISRFRDIMAANFNALLDKCEDPEKMIDQYLRDLQDDLGKVKSETAGVIADEKAAKRKLDACDEEIAKMDKYARKAVAAGNDDEARQFLARKSELAQDRVTLEQTYNICVENSAKMRDMSKKLEADIQELKGKQASLKAKLAVAETKKKMSSVGSSGKDAGARLAAFDRMEEKVNRMMDEADAMEELNEQPGDSLDALAAKYEDSSVDVAVDDELAALKAEMGM
ncbi:MAG: PspA/IM30 family protein [Lachnospiraceae bacterium]|nr:PspA/IM30 family protein [Lachnospiraceae bacterium]